jgi:KipI family sensor histidine kinase inhibitor
VNTPRFLPAGDAALMVEFGRIIDPAINAAVGALMDSLAAQPIPGMAEAVPAYASLLITFDPVRISAGALRRRIARRLRALRATPQDGVAQVSVLRVPVCYGGEYGPDLAFVAGHTGLSPVEVVARHTAPRYRIYMLGFLPGFPYLGGLDAALETPRLQTPRTQIPAGAVGIGGKQTGIYPLASPGGWQLIGRTPLRPYDPRQAQSILYKPGDCVRFEAVSPAAYAAIAARVAEGDYVPAWQREVL